MLVRQMSSIISTAVQNYCGASATTSATTALPEVTDAIKVFNSYCARSTELVWCTSHKRRILQHTECLQTNKIALPQQPSS